MPILGYERHEEWEISARFTRDYESKLRKPGLVVSRAGLSAISKPRESTLIPAYLCADEADKPLHSRRTLDQFSYYMLKSTERRDNDQVVYRWVDKQMGSNSSRPILMVDQLWLWVLPDGIHRLSIFVRLHC